ncbi:hypothetical protein [Sphingobium sp.]|uniref:hypothetical protein n=1 Tax=Sphingobium sp. TaxID=1912891 RepID=UPI0026320049|nr:hypothetical protein [Sphingobium sp.]
MGAQAIWLIHCNFYVAESLTQAAIPKNDPAVFTAGSGKGLIGHGPKSLRVASWLYAGISEILLDGSDISRLQTVSFITFSVMKCHDRSDVTDPPQ